LVNFVHGSLSNPGRIDRWAARTPPDGILANSRYTAATLDRVFPGVPVDVCYLPVAPAQHEHPELVRQQVRAELMAPPNAVIVLQASRLERWKGHRVLLDALTKLKDLPSWHLWVAGGPQKGGEQELLKELIAAAESGRIADRVRFLGQRQDVQRLMAGADIYCQPNTEPEPFGLALVEALNCRLPVVTSDLGGAREIVTEECGLRCPPGNVAALAEALRDLIVHPARRRELGAAGAARGRELCDPQSRINELSSRLHAVGALALG
jgi:glycosyltransferase involved in cell wall biosynthesis